MSISFFVSEHLDTAEFPLNVLISYQKWGEIQRQSQVQLQNGAL